MKHERIRLWATALAALIVATVAAGARADNSETPELRIELDALMTDFNLLFSRPNVAVATNTARWHQIQTFVGPFEMTPEGDWVQQEKCETVSSSNNEFTGVHDVENRITIKDGQFVIYATFSVGGAGGETYGPNLVERVGSGIRTRVLDMVWQNAWEATDFFRGRDGRLRAVRRWVGHTDWNDYWYEPDSPEAAEAAKLNPRSAKPAPPAAPAQADDGDGEFDNFDLVLDIVEDAPADLQNEEGESSPQP